MKIIDIAKGHRYETVCVVLALVLLLAFWPVSKKGSQARARMEKLEDLRSRAVSLQRVGPDGLATPELIELRSWQLEQMAGETQKIAELFKLKNRRPFLVRDMFPVSSPNAPLRFRDNYDQAIDKLLSETLRAGWPSQDALASEKKDSVAIGLYAQRDNLSIGDWVKPSGIPDAKDCWFAQLDFWIQQDLAELFDELNRASAQQRRQTPSVNNAAVKRIVEISIDSDYYVDVGQETKTSTSQNRKPVASRTPPADAQLGRFGFMPAPSLTMQGGSLGSPKPAAAQKQKAATRTQETQEKPFTGRSSDAKADVLHFSFSVVVDSRRINDLLAALSRKNLYTVLSVSLSRADVDIDNAEFRKLDPSSEAFNPYRDAELDLAYGTDPIVRLDVVVEALFLREIYAEYMPKEVKALIGGNR